MLEILNLPLVLAATKIIDVAWLACYTRLRIRQKKPDSHPSRGAHRTALALPLLSFSTSLFLAELTEPEQNGSDQIPEAGPNRRGPIAAT